MQRFGAVYRIRRVRAVLRYPGPRSSAGAESAASKTALRARSGQTRQQVFDQIDANRDGMISRSEADASPALVAIFVATDANSDGMLSAVEFALVPITFDAGTAIGGSASMGSGMGSGSAGWWPVQTPSHANETQPDMMNAIWGDR